MTLLSKIDLKAKPGSPFLAFAIFQDLHIRNSSKDRSPTTRIEQDEIMAHNADDLANGFEALNLGLSSTSIPPEATTEDSGIGGGSAVIPREPTETNEAPDLPLADSNERSSHISTSQQAPTPEERNKQRLAELIQRSIDATNEKGIVRLLPNDPYFASARDICVKHGLVNETGFERRFDNFKRLLCGVLSLPCILLLNPKHDELDFDQMIEQTATLEWIQSTLRSIGFELNDIVIMDLCPMLTDEWIDQTNQQHRAEAIHDMSQLTLNFIDTFKPQFIIACQCPQWDSRWSSLNNDPRVRLLQSSMANARGRVISPFLQNGERTNVVYGFHPANFQRGFRFAKKAHETRKEMTKERLLHNIFESVFRPYTRSFNPWLRTYNTSLQTEYNQKLQSVQNTNRELYQALLQFSNVSQRYPEGQLGNVAQLIAIRREWKYLNEITNSLSEPALV